MSSLRLNAGLAPALSPGSHIVASLLIAPKLTLGQYLVPISKIIAMNCTFILGSMTLYFKPRYLKSSRPWTTL